MSLLPVRVALQQRVLPTYRVPFFDALCGTFQGGLSIFFGKPRPDEMIETGRPLHVARPWEANNLHFLKGSLYFCWQRGWQEWLESWQPDVLILEANPRYLHVPSMAAWMRDRHLPVIGWGLGAPSAGGWVGRLRESSRRRFLGNFDALLTYSRQGAQEYIQSGFAAERIFVAPNAVSPRPFWPLPKRPEFFTGRPVLVFVGRLQARKRVDLLLRACAAIPPHNQPYLWIVGTGPVQAELEGLAREIYPQARFLGSKYGDELRPIFSQADLFVLPGTGGLAVQEAMTFGLPVMVAEADGTQTELVRPENGWLLPPGDLDALVLALKEALSDPQRLRRMGESSYDIVAGEVNLENMVRVFGMAVKSVWKGENAHSSGS